jgi:hypothetical protein
MTRPPIDPRASRKATSVPGRRPGAGGLPVRRFEGGRWALFRAMLWFQLKLAVDGLKDFLLAPLAAIAMLLDWKRAKAGQEWESFERVMGIGERFERWLALYGTPGRAPIDPDDPEDLRSGGILDEGGSDVLLGSIEQRARRLHRELRNRPGGGKPDDEGR